MTQVPEVLDLRCPQPVKRNGYCHPGRLLARLRLSGQLPSFVQPENVIEMPCDECRYRLRKQGRRVRRVLHRYDLAGQCVGTLTDEDEA